MKRRSFFKLVASIVAAVAIAPEIAFRQKLELPDTGPKIEHIEVQWFVWNEGTNRWNRPAGKTYVSKFAAHESAA